MHVTFSGSDARGEEPYTLEPHEIMDAKTLKECLALLTEARKEILGRLDRAKKNPVNPGIVPR